MSEFFGRLETELRAAAERPPRRMVPAPAVLAVVLLALALAPIVFVLGSGDDPAPERRAADEPPRADGVLAPVGSTMPEREGPGLQSRPADTTVVATGVAPVSGPWQLETYEDPAGRCLGVFLLEVRPETISWYSAICPGPGLQPLPGFGAQAMAVPARPTQREFLVYGPAPEEAAAVELVDDGKVLKRVETSEGPENLPGDVYLMTLPPDLRLDGAMRWVGDGGRTGDEVRFQLP